MNLGISLYPDKTEFKEDQAYLDKAKEFGFTRVFMSFLQIDIHNPKRSIARIKESAMYAASIGFDVDIDVHPLVFKYIDTDESNLEYFHTMGIQTLRLDTGYDGKMEAMMTQNPFGIKIEVNMSRSTHELERILDYHPNRKQLCGSHNFYPQSYTALPLSSFKQNTLRFKEHGIHTAMFINSNYANVSPWPVSEGLCTLEAHRGLPIGVQMRHMKMLHMIDDVIIGNAYASDEELSIMAQIKKETKDYITIDVKELSPIENKLLFELDQEYRGDASEYVIRSTKHRGKCYREDLPSKYANLDIRRGDILILNEKYGQYKGEVQIALKDREKDPRINVVGHVSEDEMLLVEELQPFQGFSFRRK